MREQDIPIGTRVRLQADARVCSGWRGKGTIIGSDGRAIKDSHEDPIGDTVDACTWQWVVLRDQSPNPEHNAAVHYALTGVNDYWDIMADHALAAQAQYDAEAAA